VDVQFQMGDLLFLIHPTKRSDYCNRTNIRDCWASMCAPCTTIAATWFQVQLGEAMEGSGNIPLLVTNDDDDPPQLKV